MPANRGETRLRFAIVGGGRTGSSHLVGILNRHPEILCHAEAFHRRDVVYVKIPPSVDEAAGEALKAELLKLRKSDPFAYLERIYNMGWNRPIVGFKIFERHNPEVLRHIIGERSIKKIVLFRANALARYASLAAAYEAGKWSSGAPRALVQFDEQAFVEQHNDYVSFIDRTVRELVSLDQPFRILRYDELNNEAVIAAVVNFLGATAPMPKVPDTSGARGAPDIVSRFSNPHEVEAFLRARGLMHWAFEGDAKFTALHAHASTGMPK